MQTRIRLLQVCVLAAVLSMASVGLAQSDPTFGGTSDGTDTTTTTPPAPRHRASHSYGSDNPLHKGVMSLSFALPTGGNAYAAGTAGVWDMIGDQSNLGINVGLSIDPQQNRASGKSATRWDLLLAPTLKYYTNMDSSVTPYYYGQIKFRLYSDGNPQTNDKPELGLAGGFGVEWFPVSEFSVSGQIGLGIDILRADPGTGATKPEPLAIGTFTSALAGTFYF